MIKKRKKEEIDVENINTEVVKYFYNKEIIINDKEYKPSYINIEKCSEEINTENTCVRDNYNRLMELRDKEKIRIDIENINVHVVEFMIEINRQKVDKKKKANRQKKNVGKDLEKRVVKDLEKRVVKDLEKKLKKNSEKKIAKGFEKESEKIIAKGFEKKSDKKIAKSSEKKIVKKSRKNLGKNREISQSLQSLIIVDKSFEIISDKSIEVNQSMESLELSSDKSLEISLEETPEISSDKSLDDTRIKDISTDKRFLLFLKKTKPSILKNCEDVEDYINRTESYVQEKGLENQATISNNIDHTIKKYPCRIENIKESYWTNEELVKFKFLVQKYKNNFELISQSMPSKSMRDLILRYYNSKDKTYHYIKKKSGRISDTEVNILVEKEWTDLEKSIFHDKYALYGRNIYKYKEFLCKSIKDLKIFLRWYTKNMNSKKSMRNINSSLLNEWSIDERQIFAIYFPYYNKNWITMSSHFNDKNSKDLKVYYTKYYKHLSFNEQKFEASLVDYNLVSKTDPVIHRGKDDEEWNETVGWLFR